MEGKIEEAIGLVGSLQALLTTPASSTVSSKKPENSVSCFDFVLFIVSCRKSQ